MSDAFDNVVGGKLKLKGGGIGKKKKKSKDRDDGLAHQAAAAVASSSSSAASSSNAASAALPSTVSSGHTAAEPREPPWIHRRSRTRELPLRTPRPRHGSAAAAAAGCSSLLSETHQPPAVTS